MAWSRRQILGFVGAASTTGLAGCSSSPFVGGLGFRLRNYTDEDYEARIEISLAGQSVFEQAYRLPSASGADPYVQTEPNAVSNVPKGVSYTVSLFLDGVEARTFTATMDCVDRDSRQMDEEIDIDIGFGGDDTVDMADTQC